MYGITTIPYCRSIVLSTRQNSAMLTSDNNRHLGWLNERLTSHFSRT